MKLPVLAASLTGTTAAHASQIVVTFEDIDPSAGGQIYNGYGSISGWETVGNLQDYADAHDPALGDYQFHDWGGELSFDQVPVVFEGTYYKLWGGNSQISYSLYYQGQLVYNAPLDRYNQPFFSYWLATGYSGLVDKIYFYGSSDGFVIDNLTYSTAAPVPTPSAAWVFGSGLLGLLLQKRRYRARYTVCHLRCIPKQDGVVRSKPECPDQGGYRLATSYSVRFKTLS